MKKIKVSVFEPVYIYGENNKVHKLVAKIDTGAYRSSLDETLARDWGLLNDKKVIDKKYYSNAQGVGIARAIIRIKFSLGGLKIETDINVAPRNHLLFPMLIGRLDLEKFVIEYDPKSDPERKNGSK